MVTVVVFEFSVMRCQPLRRALVSLRKESSKFKPIWSGYEAFRVRMSQVYF